MGKLNYSFVVLITFIAINVADASIYDLGNYSVGLTYMPSPDARVDSISESGITFTALGWKSEFTLGKTSITVVEFSDESAREFISSANVDYKNYTYEPYQFLELRPAEKDIAEEAFLNSFETSDVTLIETMNRLTVFYSILYAFGDAITQRTIDTKTGLDMFDYLLVSNPYMGLIGYFETPAGEKIRNYIGVVNNRTVVVVISSEKDESFASILRGLRVIPESEARKERLKEIKSMI